MCVCVCTHNSKGPGIPESCAKERVRRCSLSLPISLLAVQRGGEDSQGVGHTAFSQLFSLLFFLTPGVLFPSLLSNFCPLFPRPMTETLYSSSLSLSLGLSLAHTRCSFSHCHSLCHSPEVESLPHMWHHVCCVSPWLEFSLLCPPRSATEPTCAHPTFLFLSFFFGGGSFFTQDVLKLGWHQT